MDDEPIIIEHDIPIPERAYRRSGLTQKLREMEIGDSIVVSYGRSNAIPSIAQRLGIHTTREKIGLNRWRVWRTA